MTHYEIIKKLIGDINPIGDYKSDEQKLKNLFDLFNLVSELNEDIIYIATKFKDKNEHSVNVAKKHAINFLKNQNIQIKKHLEL